ncbi:hypothetical protein ANO11243_026240 [Dothideomycetidae sp. 11243]|nr:hypothetical protein ANO11243_026240 [fungal sp. No.11243]
MAGGDNSNDGTLGREQVPVLALPSRPSPAALAATVNIGSLPLDEKEAYRRSNHYPSLSSTALSARTVDTIDVEKQDLHGMLSEHDERASSIYSPGQRTSRVDAPFFHVGTGLDPSTHHHTIVRCYEEPDDNEPERHPNSEAAAKSVRLLLFFTFATPFLSFLLAFWTLIITLLLALLHPIRLIFTRQRVFAEIALSILTPTLNLHLRSVYASPADPADLSLWHTLAALVGAAPLSIGLACWAAILGVYWVFAVIIGNPDGLDGRSEGREMLLQTRGHWVAWLLVSSRRNEQ